MTEKVPVWGYLIIAAVLMTDAIAPVTLAAGTDNDSPFRPVVIGPHIGATGNSPLNETALSGFARKPEPVTLIRVEVSETSLPGPRYMAFGPSSIGISVNPVILSILAVLVFPGIGAWCIWKYGGKDEETTE
jgi:hypothetical protein